MALSYSQLERFYEDLVARAQTSGISCAITSGMACVSFGVSETTKDCDLLCQPTSAAALFELLAELRLRSTPVQYRGRISAPMDGRWLRGGWTSHFVWNEAGNEAYLDVFGIPPRATALWQSEIQGFYASPHTVAEMKRTDRPKDWPIATALGLKLLEAGDERGWLHLFDHDVLVQTAERVPCPANIVAQRPVLTLLTNKDDRLELALKAEVEFWHRLDRLRMRIYEQAVRAYASALRVELRTETHDFREQHQIRIEKAQELLPPNPLVDYGIARLIADAREQASRFLPEGALAWLPDATTSFTFYR
ncbi:MAG: hypothetical protein U1G07_17660 [Verrucomicrobiota bacterium]